jgi:hypothetical protein
MASLSAVFKGRYATQPICGRLGPGLERPGYVQRAALRRQHRRIAAGDQFPTRRLKVGHQLCYNVRMITHSGLGRPATVVLPWSASTRFVKRLFAVPLSPVTKLGPARRRAQFVSQTPRCTNADRHALCIKVACFVCDFLAATKVQKMGNGLAD